MSPPEKVRFGVVLPLAVLVSAFGAGNLTAQNPELRLVEELRLGRVQGSGPDAFADIDDLAVDPKGRIYVLDIGWRDVRLFDAEGRFVRRLAPEGEGPGERRYWNIGSTHVTWDALRGRLWIDDGLQRLVLDSLGVEYARAARMPSFVPPNSEPIGRVVGVDTRGRLYERLFGPSSNRDSTNTYVARGVADSEYAIALDPMLRLEAQAVVEEEPRTHPTPGGSVVATFRRLLPSQTVWTVSPAGALWVANVNERRLRELAMSGDTLRTVTFSTSGGEPEWAELDVSPEGWFWMRREAGFEESATTWDILDDCGAYQGFASLPHDVSMTEVGSGGQVHVVATNTLDVDYVLRLRLANGSDSRC